MFDGTSRTKPRMSMRGKSKEEEKTELLRRARLEREQRKEEKEKRKAAAAIVRFYRRRASIASLKAEARGDMIRRVEDLWRLRPLLQRVGKPLPTQVKMMEALVAQLLLVYDPAVDLPQLQQLATLLVDSLRNTNAEWNFGSLRASNPSSYEAEVVRLCRLCLEQICYRGKDDREGTTVSVYLDLLDLLVVEPLSSSSCSGDTALTWQILLSLATETSSLLPPPSPPPPSASQTSVPSSLSPSPYMSASMSSPPPTSNGASRRGVAIAVMNSHIAYLRRSMGLPTMVRGEMQRLLEHTGSSEGPHGRPLSLLWKMAMAVLGVAAQPTPLHACPAELGRQRSTAAQQLARAILLMPRLMQDPHFTSLVTSLRQNKCRGLWMLVEAWVGAGGSGMDTMELMMSTSQPQSVHSPAKTPRGGQYGGEARVQMDVARVGAAGSAVPLQQQGGGVHLKAVFNLIDVVRTLLAQGDLNTNLTYPLIRVLEFCVSRVPLDFSNEDDGSAMARDALRREASGDMEVEPMDLSDDEGGHGGGGGVHGSSSTSTVGEGLSLGAEGVEGAIVGMLARRRKVVGSGGRGGGSSEGLDEVARAAQGALRDFCSGRDLHRLFDRLLAATPQMPPAQPQGVEQPVDPVLSVCRLCSHVLVNSEESVAGHTAAARSGGLVSLILNLLAYHSTAGGPFVTRLWMYLSPQVARRQTWADTTLGTRELLERVRPALHLLFSVYSHQLMALDDEEFFSRQHPLPLDQVAYLVDVLRGLLHRLYWADPVVKRTWDSPNLLEDLQLMRSATRLFNQLYQRHTRRHLPLPSGLSNGESLWHWPPMTTPEFDRETAAQGPMDGMQLEEEDGDGIESILKKSEKPYHVLTNIPQVLPFRQRVSIFHRLLASDKNSSQDRSEAALLYGTRIRVRRPQIYEDAFSALNKLGSRLKGRIQVTFVSDLDMEEAGIDGGGVFKEFLDALTRRAFDPQYALFRATPDHLLYPNPLSDLATGSDGSHLQHFEFLGRVLGKAVYESILVEPQFALFFFQRVAGKLNETDDLYSMDPELYRHLMSLKAIKNQGGNVADLSLNFEVVTQDDLGQAKVAELVPGGRSVPVTNDNVFRYIQLMANYKLNSEINVQVQAFVRGFRDLIPMSWLRMFDAEELQLLLGGEKRALDIDNMQANTHYSGGYHPSQPIIQWFWTALRSFTKDQQAEFLMFVTSCSRQPLLGFAHLKPPLCIQRVPLPEGEDVRLPSASTCMNLLKLPAYASYDVLREKLLYAITSGAGFELS